MRRVCSKCKIEKHIDEFNKKKNGRDGICPYCRVCNYEYTKKFRKTEAGMVSRKKEALLPSTKKRNREYDNSKHGKNVRATYKKSERGKRLAKEAISKFPQAQRARSMLGTAVRSGKLVRKTSCEKCGSDKHIDAHHDDYARVLDVIFLCRACHTSWHQNNIPLNRV